MTNSLLAHSENKTAARENAAADAAADPDAGRAVAAAIASLA
jgi:hypothetical protein